MKSELKVVSNVLTLISAIIQSVCLVFFLITFLLTPSSVWGLGLVDGMLYDEVTYFLSVFRTFYTVYLFLMILALALLWVTRTKAAQGSLGWSVYGIVHTSLCLDFIGLAGYICSTIDANRQRKAVVTAEEKELEKQIRIQKLQNELDDIKSGK